MTFSENAHVIGAEELKEMINEKCTNPTIERLMFVEAKSKKDDEISKVFPCYIEAYGERTDKEATGNADLQFQVCLVHSVGGEFGMVKVIIPAKDLGVTKRIWSKPPTKGLRNETPWAQIGGGLQ